MTDDELKQLVASLAIAQQEMVKEADKRSAVGWAAVRKPNIFCTAIHKKHPKAEHNRLFYCLR